MHVTLLEYHKSVSTLFFLQVFSMNFKGCILEIIIPAKNYYSSKN